MRTDSQQGKITIKLEDLPKVLEVVGIGVKRAMYLIVRGRKGVCLNKVDERVLRPAGQ